MVMLSHVRLVPRRDACRERPLLRPLPDEPFETGKLLSLRMDRYAQVSIRTNRYSVPVGLIGRTVGVMLHASEVVVYDGRKEVAQHERLIVKGQARLELDHYLEALVRKPGAFPGATALEQARPAGKFTPVHDAWWAVSAYSRKWLWQDFRLRREALLVRVEVEDLHQPAVAAVGLKLRAA